MRRVACYSASSFLRDGESPEQAGDLLIGIVAKWLHSRGLEKLELGESTLESDVSSIVRYEKTEFRDQHIWEISLDESHENGRFFTRICIGIGAKRVFLFVELRAGGGDMLVAPKRVDVRCPRVVRDLLDVRVWSVGNTPARTKALTWFDREAAERFRMLIHHPERNLPIIAVSHFDGAPITPSLPGDMARDLSGLAVVVELNEFASWAITDELGKEWSCYNGAVRLFWPYRGKRISAFAHPIWLRERLIEKTGSAINAAEQIRDQLRRQLLELSTYTFDEQKEFLQLRADAQRHKFDELRGEAARGGDAQKFTEQLFEEYSKSEDRRRELEEENFRLRAQVQGLLDEFSRVSSGVSDDVPPEAAIAIQSVAQAVHQARKDFGDELVFGLDVDENVALLNEEAGPPDKVYDYLKTLAELSRAKKAGLGKDILSWLRERGVKASGESETILNNATEMRKRRWHDGTARREFDMHLKPADGTSPDRCVRIYFDWSEVSNSIVVGYVGRHP